MRSIQAALDAARGRPSGFDYMRIVLAVGVVCTHSVNVSYGLDYTFSLLEGPYRLVVAPILPVFFALSGFLVAGSLERCATLVTFGGLRILRIVPALAVEVFLSALLLGPIFTDLSLGAYTTSPVFWAYFLNILGEIHFELPGVFSANPVPNVVNSQLWTVPFELLCYISLTALTVVGVFRSRRLFGLVLVGIQVALVAYVLVKVPGPTYVVRGPLLVATFLVGVGFSLWRDRIPMNAPLFFGSTALVAVLVMVPFGDFFLLFPATYVTVYLGTLNPPRRTIFLKGDLSYGVFLYGFPIQQACVALWPGSRHWYLNILLAVPLSLVVAALSWNLVEKPALRLRHYLQQAEAWLVARRPALLYLLLVVRRPSPGPTAAGREGEREIPVAGHTGARAAPVPPDFTGGIAPPSGNAA